jgi:hypothetical protein
MMKETKIQLLPAEIELVSNAGFILTKNAILDKLKYMLEEIQRKQQNILKDYAANLPPEILKTSPKISRGENYKGLPWLVLDNPRHFIPKNIFAIRTMFWWGNFFSVTLHLSGHYKNELEKKIPDHLPLLREKGFFISCGQHEWEHDVSSDEYVKIADADMDELSRAMASEDFLKLAKTYPVNDRKIMEDICSGFEMLLKVCS